MREATAERTDLYLWGVAVSPEEAFDFLSRESSRLGAFCDHSKFALAVSLLNPKKLREEGVKAFLAAAKPTEGA